MQSSLTKCRMSGSALLTAAIAAAATFAVGGWSHPAEAVTTYGTLGNFDVVNDTGSEAHGFEIDMEGISVGDVTDVFGGVGRYFPPSVERYGAPVINAIAGGVSVVYSAAFTGSWAGSVGTPTGALVTGGESCWSGGSLGYGPATPCDHFGVGTSKAPTSTTYKWLVPTSDTAPILGSMIASLPAPIMTVPTPPPAGSPPHVVAMVVAPPSPPPPLGAAAQFGTPEWVKVFTTQYDHPVALEDLLGNNGVVPQTPGETEIEWQLLQVEYGTPGSGMLENGGDAGAGAESVLRRYEFYKYAGALTGEGEVVSDSPILDAAGNPVSPASGGNIGAFIGDQNVALNLNGVFAGPPMGVPEPAGIALFATGLLGLLGLRRRRS